MSAVAPPLAGRCSCTGFPVSEQELFVVEKLPSAARFRSTSFPGTETPAVVGSTTTMSFAVAAGAAFVRAITSSDTFGGATTSETLFDFVPFGLRTCTLTLPGDRHVRRRDWRDALACRSARRGSRDSRNQQRRSRSGVRRREPASIDAQHESRPRARVDAGRMQRQNVCAARDRHAGRARLRCVVFADRHHLQRVRRWRGVGRGVRAVLCDRAAHCRSA